MAVAEAEPVDARVVGESHADPPCKARNAVVAHLLGGFDQRGLPSGSEHVDAELFTRTWHLAHRSRAAGPMVLGLEINVIQETHYAFFVRRGRSDLLAYIQPASRADPMACVPRRRRQIP